MDARGFCISSAHDTQLFYRLYSIDFLQYALAAKLRLFGFFPLSDSVIDIMIRVDLYIVQAL